MTALAFEFRDQLNGPWDTAGPYLVEQLDRTYAALGQMSNVTDAVTSSGVTSVTNAWVTVPFDATNFSSNSTGSITPSGNAPYVVVYKILGSVMWLNASFSATVNNGTTTEVRMRIPGNATLGSLPVLAAVADENRQRTACLWNGGVTAGVAGAFINLTGRYISVQRWDGTAAAGYPTATCFFGFMVTVPLAGS